MSRRFARALIRHARAVLPPGREAWGRAMSAEFEEIPDAEGLEFALGCVWASYTERVRPMSLLIVAARWAVAAVTLLTAAFHLFVPTNMLLIANELRTQGLSGRLGEFATFRGADTADAIAAVAAIPVWQYALMYGLAAAYLLAAWALIRWSPRLLVLSVGAGALLSATAWLAAQGLGAAPYLVHPDGMAIEFLALALLAIAGLVFWTAPRLLGARPAAA